MQRKQTELHTALSLVAHRPGSASLLKRLYLLFISGLISFHAVAQPQADTRWQTELTKRYTQLSQHTLRLARQHNWPLQKQYGSNRQLTLQEIDAFGHPVYYTLHNTEASFGTRTAALYAGGSLGASLSGGSASVAGKLAIWDGGNVLATHQEFGGRIVSNNTASAISDHTTHLAGTLIAQGINPAAKGMAFKANLSVWDYTNDITEIASVANKLLISNHAYGPVAGWINNSGRPGTDPNLKWEWWGNTSMSQTEDYLFGFYTTKARDFDKIAFSNPYYLVVRSADNKHAETGPPTGTPYFLANTNEKSTAPRSRNDGYDVIPGEATAKNVLTVGAGEATLSASNEPTTLTLAAYSGWGPTDDGRIKPDLLGIGTNVLSTISSGNTVYGTASGTSMASANVAGSLLLLQELYAQNHNGQVMRSATLRGLALHTATRTVTTKAGIPGPDYRQGWGMLNVEKAAQVVLNATQNHLLLERSLVQNGVFSQSVVAQGNEPLTVTLCWTDPEGQPTPVSPGNLNNRTPVLVNDLDLRVSDNTGAVLPWVLDPSHPEQPATPGDNIRDNIEQVYIANPLPGKAYTITVTHKNTLKYGAQPFSVVASGLRQTACSLAVSLTPNRDTTLCAGKALTLNAVGGAEGTTYDWLLNGAKIGATTRAYQATQTGYYTVRATNRNGCTGTSTAIYLKLQTPTATILPTGDIWQCSPTQPVQVTAVATAVTTYQWLRNGQLLTSATTPTLSTTQPGNYQVQLTQHGCTGLSRVLSVSASTVNSVRLVPDVSELLIPRGASVRLSTLADPTYQYKWYRSDQPITNATTNRLSVNQPGVYRVQVSQQSCVGLSPTMTVRWADGTGTTPLSDSLLSYEPMADSLLVIFPNPVASQLTIQYKNPAAQAVSVSIYNLQGAVWRSNIPVQEDTTNFQLNVPVADLPPGNYLIRLTDGTRSASGRFMKH